MKKAINLIMCIVLIFGFAPNAAIAAETTQKQSVEFGIEKGDIVSFAGKDNTPIRWRVINAAKSNAGNANGMLLLSEDTVEEVADNSMSHSLARLNTVYKSFYDKYFAEFYRNAVIPTTLKNTSVSIYRCEDELKDDTVFSLSKSEAENLTVEERKFKNKKWLLRTIREHNAAFGKYDFTYVDPNGDVAFAAIGNENKSGYSFRPAVNIDKTKLAQLDGKPLLLPVGEYSDAGNKLASLSAASEWKLTQKDDSVTITSATFDEKDNNEYEITVGTNLTKPDGDDYISLIIKRSDGSISHYGRYAMTKAEKTFTVTLPADYNKANDSVYVFYENYKGALSGSAGEITEICLHDYGCASVDDKIHRYTCKRCAHFYDEEHKYGTIADYADKEVGCLVCERRDNFMVKKVYFEEEPVFAGKTTSARTEYNQGSLKFANCYYNSYAKNNFFKYDQTTKLLTTYSKGERAVVTFQTTTPIRATGFQISTDISKTYIPTNVILYGKKGNSDDDYKKIGSAFLKPILPEKNSYVLDIFSFLFTDQTNFAAYDSFKVEMDNESATDIRLRYFGLLSDQSSSFSVSADGAAVDGAEPSKAYPGEDLSLTLTSKSGHPSGEEISLFINDKQDTEKIYEYSQDTGVFKLPGDKIESGKNYVLKAECGDKSVNVDFELNRVTIIDKDNAEYGKSFRCVFRDANGKTDYAPQKQDIKVFCGEKDITANCTYTDYALNIPAKYVIGNLKIIANEKNCIQKETSKIKVEKKGEQTRWYDSFSDAQNNYVVDTKGKDGVLIAAAYNGDSLLGTKFKELTRESGVLKLNDILSLSEIAPENDGADISEVKLFFWDRLNGMMPLSEVTHIEKIG